MIRHACDSAFCEECRTAPLPSDYEDYRMSQEISGRATRELMANERPDESGTLDGSTASARTPATRTGQYRTNRATGEADALSLDRFRYAEALDQEGVIEDVTGEGFCGTPRLSEDGSYCTTCGLHVPPLARKDCGTCL